MAPTVVVADVNLVRVKDRLEETLDGVARVRWAEDGDPTPLLADADVLVAGGFTVAQAQAAPALRLLQVPGAGLNGVDPAALAAHARTRDGDRLVVANTFHHEAAMAEYAVWAAVGLRRRLATADAALRRNVWRSPGFDPAEPLLPALDGALVAFLGFGHIGAYAWRAFRALGARGVAVTGSGSVDAGAHGLAWAGDVGRLGEAFEQADVVIVSVPLVESTRGLVGTDELRALGPDGVVINLARGPVVDEAALHAALTDGTIAGAAIDVWYSYPDASGGPTPPATLDFSRLTNTLLTPHISGVSLQTVRDRVDDVVHNVRAVLTGDGEVRNRVDDLG